MKACHRAFLLHNPSVGGMTANPALVAYDDQLGPQPYSREFIALRRDFVDLDIDNLRTASGRWKARGTLYLTDLRLVFVARQRDEVTNLQAFDFPLAYIRKDKFNQPVFGCNNLSGEVWPVAEGAGPGGSLPPHKYALCFKDGGVGTFLPTYYHFLEAIRQTHQQHLQQQPNLSAATVESDVATAFVDPSDPTKVFLTQPVDQADRIPTAPVYAPDYKADRDEVYEDIDQPNSST